MATTPCPLVWDFYRTVDGATDLGGVVHYYDEMSQSIYLSSGLKTDVAGVPEGHWENAARTEDIQITNDAFNVLRFDHPSNGTLYGVASDGKKLTFLRYVYGMDISQIVDSWSWLTQNDTSIAQFDSTVQNIDPDIFGIDSSLFQPGARIRTHIFMGDSNAYPIGTVWLDESGYGQLESTVRVSGRNTVGYYLKDQTFDDNTVFEGTITGVLTSILDYAGLSSYQIQSLTSTCKFEFKPSDTLLDGIQKILEFYTTIDKKMEIVELTDGTICIGYEDWVSEYLPRNYYSFDDGREVFKRNTTRASDGSYSKIRATGKDADGNDLQAVTVDVDNFRYWSLGRHRTKHVSAPDGLTQNGLQQWAEAQAKILQYIGVAEEFVGPFRPQLVVGDIAEVVRGDTGTSLGVVTQVKQVFDRQNGFMTEFSVDSGGVATDTDGNIIYSRSAKVNGYNRKQSLIDLIRYTAEKTGKVDSLTASDVGAEKKGTSGTLLSEHNENRYAHPDIRELANKKLPMPEKASAGQYLRVLSVDEDGTVTGVEAVSANTGGDGGIVGDIDAATLEGKTLDEVVELASKNSKVANVVNYEYKYTSSGTTHTRSYTGTTGNMLLLAIMHRGELATAPSGWALLGTIEESGDRDVGSVAYIQYVSVFYKKCVGDEEISYEQTESNNTITCIIEFEGISGFEILEDSVQENVPTKTEPEFTFSRKSTRLAVWFTNSLYFPNNTYKWVVSDADIWAISDNHTGVQPRLGVFVDNRPSPTTFTVDTGMGSTTTRYASAFCIQIVP